MIDSHAHIDFPDYDIDREQIIADFPKHGIEAIINAGANLECSSAACGLSDRHERVYATVGVHPHEANIVDDEIISQLGDLILRHKKVVAVGETGLDYTEVTTSKSEQKDAFLKQVALAKKFDLPLVVHCRDAYEDIFKLLDGADGKGVKKVLLHCYTGSLGVAMRALEHDFFISFSGIVTFPKAKQVQEVAKVIPGDRFMIETDCPSLAPQPVRGKRNEPRHVRHTAEFIANLRGVSIEELDKQTTQNTKGFFSLP